MARQNISIGSSANDGTGDTLRSAGNKINQNFQEVYTQLGGDSSNLSTLVKLLDSASTGVVLFEGTSTDSHETKLIATDQTLDLALGFSHNILLEVAPEVKVETITEKGKNPIIKLTSHDKQLIGFVAAKIRSFRKPEPYKGKGIRFVGEQIRRKAGKSA